MKKYILSNSQRKFLITWICFHLFALATYLVPIKGEIKNGDYTYYIFTYTGEFREAGFWPFVKFYNDQGLTVWRGIFARYDYREFMFYILIGLLIIYVPKLWNDKK